MVQRLAIRVNLDLRERRTFAMLPLSDSALNHHSQLRCRLSLTEVRRTMPKRLRT